jgi:trans-aconitate methyltransferase
MAKSRGNNTKLSRAQTLGKTETPTANLFDQISTTGTNRRCQRNPKTNPVHQNHPQNEGLILDLACGNARHTHSSLPSRIPHGWLRRFPTFTGVSQTESATATVDCRFVRADMRFLPFRSEAFTTVISLDASFGYQSTPEEDQKT